MKELNNSIKTILREFVQQENTVDLDEETRGLLEQAYARVTRDINKFTLRVPVEFETVKGSVAQFYRENIGRTYAVRGGFQEFHTEVLRIRSLLDRDIEVIYFFAKIQSDLAEFHRANLPSTEPWQPVVGRHTIIAHLAEFRSGPYGDGYYLLKEPATESEIESYKVTFDLGLLCPNNCPKNFGPIYLDEPRQSTPSTSRRRAKGSSKV